MDDDRGPRGQATDVVGQHAATNHGPRRGRRPGDAGRQRVGDDDIAGRSRTGVAHCDGEACRVARVDRRRVGRLDDREVGAVDGDCGGRGQRPLSGAAYAGGVGQRAAVRRRGRAAEIDDDACVCGQATDVVGQDTATNHGARRGRRPGNARRQRVGDDDIARRPHPGVAHGDAVARRVARVDRRHVGRLDDRERGLRKGCSDGIQRHRPIERDGSTVCEGSAAHHGDACECDDIALKRSAGTDRRGAANLKIDVVS